MPMRPTGQAQLGRHSPYPLEIIALDPTLYDEHPEDQ